MIPVIVAVQDYPLYSSQYSLINFPSRDVIYLRLVLSSEKLISTLKTIKLSSIKTIK